MAQDIAKSFYCCHWEPLQAAIMSHVYSHMQKPVVPFLYSSQLSKISLGKGRCAKSDEFRKSAKRGGGIFNPKIYVADFGNFIQGFLSMQLIQKE